MRGVTRRGVLAGASAGLLAPRSSRAVDLGAMIPTIIPRANAAVQFSPGTVLLNGAGAGVFSASEPHQLVTSTSPWGYLNWMMASTTVPTETHPIFGLNGVNGQIYKVEILPPNWYYIYPPGRNPNLGPVQTHFGVPILQVYVGNHNGVQSIFQNWIAQLPNVYDGVFHLIESFLNPRGDPVGSPLSHRVFVDNVEVNVYPGPGQNPRALNNIFEIPWGADSGYPAPTAWVGFDYPIYGGDPGEAFIQNNSYVGILNHLWWDPNVPIDPSMSRFQFMRPDGGLNLILPPRGANVLYPGQVPPAVYLHGDASSGERGFRHNQGIISGFSDQLNLDTRFSPADGFVTIEDITIGGPAGVE